MKRKQLTGSSTFEQEEERKERGSCGTLTNIPLRSMLLNTMNKMVLEGGLELPTY